MSQAAKPEPQPEPKKRRRRARVEPEVPLGSLSQPLAVPAGTKTCAACESSTLTRVPMRLGSGESVTFVSCQDCEERVWVTSDGELLDVSEVLGRADRK